MPLTTEAPSDDETVETMEAQRLAALRSYNIMDTPAEQGFDDIVLLARQICHTPVALISLVDRDRQWFKARIGFDPAETPIEQSICAHALTEPDILVIPDLTQDPRTLNNTLVTAEPHLRFYAGAPLRTPEGHVLGTLCVIDRVARPGALQPAQAAALRALANRVMVQLATGRINELRDQALIAEQRVQRVLRSSVERFEAVVAAQDIIAAADGNLDIILNAVCTAGLQAVDNAEGSVVELRDDNVLVYRAVAGSMSAHLGQQVPLDGSLSGRCILSGRPMISADVEAEAGADPALSRLLGIRSMIVVPISHRGDFIGALKLTSNRLNAFSERDVKLAQLLAGAAAAGLAHAGDLESRKRVWDTEARYRAVFESAVDFAIIVMDLDGTVTNWNTGATRILGWHPAEMIGKTVAVFFTPEDREAGLPEREMGTALVAGRGLDERWHLKKDGTRFWANGEMMPLRSEDGRAIGFLKILRDRTSQRQAEESLLDSERRLRLERGLLQAVFQQAPVGILIAQASTEGVMANAMLEGMVGRPEGDDRRPRATADHDGDARRGFDLVEDAAMRALRNGEILRNVPVVHRNSGTGELRRLELSSAPVYAEPEEIVAAVTIVADVEQQRAAAEALLRSEERLALAFDASGSLGWWDWNIADDQVYASAVFAEAYGLDPQSGAAGLPMEQFLAGIHPDDRDWVGRKIAEAVETAGEFSEEYRLQRPGRAVTWLYARGRCYHDAAGRPSRFPGVSLDITARKQAEHYQAAVVELSDRLRETDDTADLAFMAAEIIARTLGIDRAGYGTVDAADETIRIERDWHDPALRSIAGEHHFRDYGSFIDDLKRGETVAITDTYGDFRTATAVEALARIDVRAFVNVPVVERRQTVALLYLHATTPRVWSDAELAFARDVAVRTRTAIERLRTDERQRLLNHELSHRMKNNLAMVQAITAQTLRNSSSLEGARDALLSRLVALGKAHDMLLEGGTDKAHVGTIVAGALELHDDSRGRFKIQGVSLMVGPSAALSLSLMLHELATNATKYGALSNGKGLVAIDWLVQPVDGVETFILTWVEQGGPPVTPPVRKGFGSRLIERGFGGATGGAVAIDYRSTGLVCTLAAPLRGFQASD